MPAPLLGCLEKAKLLVFLWHLLLAKFSQLTRCSASDGSYAAANGKHSAERAARADEKCAKLDTRTEANGCTAGPKF